MATTTDKDKAADGGKADAGQAEVQAKVDEAEAKGYEGWVPDETPNEAYSLESPGFDQTPEVKRGEEARAAREAAHRQ